MKLSTCPKALRKQRAAVIRLAAAMRASDRAEAAAERARARLDKAFNICLAGQASKSRAEVRSMLELAGLVERKVLCATNTDPLP